MAEDSMSLDSRFEVIFSSPEMEGFAAIGGSVIKRYGWYYQAWIEVVCLDLKLCVVIKREAGSHNVE